jgi:prolyl-tRNA editing enzyme YbaK/EbsC (Cys-tRNA(Pro) deacylase)
MTPRSSCLTEGAAAATGQAPADVARTVAVTVAAAGAAAVEIRGDSYLNHLFR